MAFVIAAAAIALLAAIAALFARFLPSGGLGSGGLLLIGLVVAEVTFGAGLLVTRPGTETAEEVADLPFEPAPLPLITPGPTPPPTTTPAPRRRRTTVASPPVASPTIVPPPSTPPPVTEPDPDETPEEDDICPADNPADPDCEDFTPAPP